MRESAIHEGLEFVEIGGGGVAEVEGGDGGPEMFEASGEEGCGEEICDW